MSLDYLWTDECLTSYEVENRFDDTTITFVMVSKNVLDCYDKLINFFDPWIKHYPWTISPPNITQQTTTINDITINYIYGELNYHDYANESSLMISILFQFTKHYKDSYIHIFDSVIIEPLLIECHNFLPNDLQDVNSSINRAWIHDYNVIVLNLHGDRFTDMFSAMRQLSNGDFVINHQITDYWRQNSGWEQALSTVYDFTFTDVRIDIAKLITNDPTLVSKALIALEHSDFDVGPVKYHNAAIVDVRVPVNQMTIASLSAICYPDNSIGKVTAQQVIQTGLIKYFSSGSPLVPEDVKQVSRMDLQNELSRRGVLEHPVKENDEIYDLIQPINPDAVYKTEEFCTSQLNEILNSSELPQIFKDEDFIPSESDSDDDSDDDSDYDELSDFRDKYHEITDIWLEGDELIQKHREFKSRIVSRLEDFRKEFENTEFEDFPEFIETSVMLESFGNDQQPIYQGDMSYSEYLKFKKDLQRNGELVDDDNEDDDDEWEDIDEEEEEEEEDAFETEDEEVYQDEEKIMEIYEPETIEKLSENLQNLQTSDKPTTNLEERFLKTRKSD